MTKLKFTKMHGLGNDFMVIDGINQKFNPRTAPIAAWAQRHTGVGFDQLLLIEAPRQAEADFRYRIFNADGSEVEQCGNGARCFARFVYDKGLTSKKQIVVETAGGVIVPRLTDDGLVTVDMGVPLLAPEQIPFTAIDEDDARSISHQLVIGNETVSVTCVNMGNPHAVIVVKDIEQAPVHRLGAAIENHKQFPQRVNVGFMQIVAPRRIRLRVFERGVGETQACGTGACAAVVAGISLGLLGDDEPVEVNLTGGQLLISWQQQPDAHVWMTGPTQSVFDGEIDYL
ncbi:diaminopimelate epimerase [Snodgrassella sp. B3837]|uniref:diaminopimelate epimerase n=1 Tax=Snodgrassella sp. B3837 TaxID=2818040 RepID=UPI00226AF3CC|nr:diaminopimelate epimerase [Snodgrassella sp. B3837]MCX8752490.1 diaminopimelate epimerase [Snodgrassella sp. B3837]